MQAVLALACAGFAAGHAALLIWTQYKGIQSGLVNWPVLLAPAALTTLLIPSSWRYWKRWVLLYFIVVVCNPVLLPQVIVAAETVVLYSIWIRDRQPIPRVFKNTAQRALRRVRPTVPRRFRPAASRATGGDFTASSTEPAPGPGRKAKPADPRAKTGPTPKRPTKRQQSRAHAQAR